MSHVRISGFFSTLLTLVLATLLVLPTSLALAQEYPPGVDPNAEETPVDLENPGEIIVDIDDSNVTTPAETDATPTDEVVEEIDFAAVLEVLRQLPEAPAFLDRLETEEDLDTLSEEEQEQFNALIQLAFGGPSLEAGPDLGELPNTLSCFDHYTFGSVQTNVYHPNGVTTLPAGTTTTFTLLVENENPYPVVNGAVYGKLYRTDLPMNQRHGYPLVAEGFLKEGINVAGEREYTDSVIYTIPEYLPAGTYELVTYFSTNYRYNLLGLPFTDDVWGNPSTFTIENERELNNGVIFDKDAATLNGDPYAFAAFTPKVSPEEPVTITATLENTTDVTVTVPITTTLYGWDQQDRENELSTDEETVTLAPGETTTITRTVTETAPNYAVYLLSLTATHEDAQSIVNLRFTREDIDAVRINFPTLLSFPLIAGEENALFSCLHGAGTKHVIENTELTLTLTDKTGNTLYTHTYNGPTTGAMMATLGSFTPERTYTDVTLTARLQHNGALVEAATVHYDCAAIEGLECTPPEVVTTTADSSTPTTTLLFTIASIILLLLIGGIGITLYQKRHGREVSYHAADAAEATRPTDLTNFHEHMTEQNKTPEEEKTAPKKNTGTKLGMFLVLVLAGGLLLPLPGDVAEAQLSTTVTKSHSGMLYRESDPDSSGNTIWWKALQNPQISVGYGATIYKYVSGVGSVAVPHGGSVPVGTLVKFTPSRGSVSYTGTGYMTDTPSGEWKSGAGWLTDSPDFLTMGWFFGTTINMRYGTCDRGFIGALTIPRVTYVYLVYIPLSVHTANMGVNLSGSTAGLSLVGSGPWYRVTSPGSLRAQFAYDSTYAKFYYEYTWRNACLRSWNQYPLAPESSCSALTGWEGLTCSNTNYSIPINSTSIQYNLTATSCPGGTTWDPGSGTCSSNQAPTTYIDAPSNDHTVRAGENISFDGRTTDPDTGDAITQYQWRSGNCTTGTLLSSSEDFSTNTLAAGTHTIFFRAYDGEAWSTNCPSVDVIINANQIPEASISSPPNISTVTEDDLVTFTGSGSDLDTDPITAYEWRSGNCTTGTLLDTAATFQNDTLPVGDHTIYLRVSDGTDWSTNCPSVLLTVEETELTVCQNGSPVSSIRSLGDGETEDLTIHSGSANDCSDPDVTSSVTMPGTGNTPDDAVTVTSVAGPLQRVTGVNPDPGSRTETVDITLGAKSTTLTYTVHPEPTLTFTPNPATPLTAGDDANDDVTLSWTVTDATSCTASGDWSGAKNAGGGWQTISDLTSDQTYTLSCTGPGGTTPEETVTVDVLSRPDLTFAGYSIVPSAGFDMATGEYHYLEFSYRIENNGETTAGGFANSLTFDGSGAVDDPPSVSSLAAGATTPNVTVVRLANNVPFGAHQIILNIDNTDAVSESDETNNTLTVNTTIDTTLPPPDPEIELEITPDLVRSGDTAEVTWDVKTTFFNSCTVLGQGVDETFDPADPSVGTTGSAETAPIKFKTEYLLTCTTVDAAGNTHTFADSAFVETVGTYEEI